MPNPDAAGQALLANLLITLATSEPHHNRNDDLVCHHCQGEEVWPDLGTFVSTGFIETTFTHEPSCHIELANQVLALWGYTPSFMENGQPRSYDRPGQETVTATS